MSRFCHIMGPDGSWALVWDHYFLNYGQTRHMISTLTIFLYLLASCGIYVDSSIYQGNDRLRYSTLSPMYTPTAMPTVPTMNPMNGVRMSHIHHRHLLAANSTAVNVTTASPTAQPTSDPTTAPTRSPSCFLNPSSSGWSAWRGWGAVTDDMFYSIEPPFCNDTITEICVRETGYIKAIKVSFASGETMGWFGGSGGTESCFQLHDDECITWANVRYGSWIDALQFRTSDGNDYRYGGSTGRAGNNTGDPGECILKLDVYAGPNLFGSDHVIRIRFYFSGVYLDLYLLNN